MKPEIPPSHSEDPLATASAPLRRLPSPPVSPAPQPPARFFGPAPDGDDLAEPWKQLKENDVEQEYDYDDYTRERELLLEELASDTDDYTRSAEDGWFYSDED